MTLGCSALCKQRGVFEAELQKIEALPATCTASMAPLPVR